MAPRPCVFRAGAPRQPLSPKNAPGLEMRRAEGELVFAIGPSILVVREARRGEHPGINNFSVLIDRYDHAEAARRMKALGPELQFEAARDVPYFTDPDGIVVYLAEAQ